MSEGTADLTLSPSPEVAPEDAPKMRRNVSVLAGAQLITWTMTLLWTLVVPRTLGPTNMGTLMAAWAVTGILGVLLGLGTRNYLVREAVVRPDSASGLIGTALVLRWPCRRSSSGPRSPTARSPLGQRREDRALPGCRSDDLRPDRGASPGRLPGDRADGVPGVLGHHQQVRAGPRGHRRRAVGLPDDRHHSLLGRDDRAVVLLNLYWLHGRLRIDARTSVRRMAAVARASIPYWAFGLFFMVYLWIDFVMLSLLTTREVVGWYAAPTRLFQTLMFLPVAVATAWLPHFVRGFEEGDEQLRDAARQPVELVLLLSLPIAALTAVSAGPVIHLLYGPDYAHSVPVLAILGLCIPAMYMNIMLGQVLIAMKRQIVWTWVMATTTVVNPLLNLALIPMTQHRYGNGAIGAAISLLLTEIVVVTAGFWLIGRRVFDGGSARRAALGSVAAAAAGGAAYALGGVIGWIPALIVGLLVFAGVSALLRVFTPGEIELMRQGMRKVTRRLPGLKRFRRRRGRGPDALGAAEHPLDAADGPANSAPEAL